MNAFCGQPGKLVPFWLTTRTMPSCAPNTTSFVPSPFTSAIVGDDVWSHVPSEIDHASGGLYAAADTGAAPVCPTASTIPGASSAVVSTRQKSLRLKVMNPSPAAPAGSCSRTSLVRMLVPEINRQDVTNSVVGTGWFRTPGAAGAPVRTGSPRGCPNRGDSL